MSLNIHDIGSLTCEQ